MDILPHEKKIVKFKKTIEEFKEHNADNPLFEKEIKDLELKLEDLKKNVYSELTPWERITICRHPSRPRRPMSPLSTRTGGGTSIARTPPICSTWDAVCG